MERRQQRHRLGIRITSFCLFALLAAAAGSAPAFIDPPLLIPSNPVVGDIISVSIRHGECDGFHADPPQISRVGNEVHMLLATSHYDDPLWCNSPISTAIFDVGSFPMGSYVLHVERFYNNAVPAPVYETLASIEFTVQGQASVALPASGAITGLLLILGIVVVACGHAGLAGSGRKK